MDSVSEVRREGKTSWKNTYIVHYFIPCSRREMDGWNHVVDAFTNPGFFLPRIGARINIKAHMHLIIMMPGAPACFIHCHCRDLNSFHQQQVESTNGSYLPLVQGSYKFPVATVQ